MGIGGRQDLHASGPPVGLALRADCETRVIPTKEIPVREGVASEWCSLVRLIIYGRGEFAGVRNVEVRV